MTTKKEEKKRDFEAVLKEGRAGKLAGSTIKTFVGTYERKIFGADFDVPLALDGTITGMDIREKLEEISKFLPMAEKVRLTLIGNLAEKDAFRVRIKGIYLEVAKEK